MLLLLLLLLHSQVLDDSKGPNTRAWQWELIHTSAAAATAALHCSGA
jgi:hypothetical protein